MRFGTTNYFVSLVKLTGNFKIYYTRGKKSLVLFCEGRVAPAHPKSQKQKPLTRITVYFFGGLATQVKNYYKKGDYVLVQGRLKIFKKQPPKNHLEASFFPRKEYHLNVIKMSLIRSS